MNLYTLIKKPIITEKSLAASKNNSYTFEVDPLANKNQIKQAIESFFNVSVVAIRTSIKKPLDRKTGRKRLPSKTSKRKYAMVEIKPGETIKAFDIKG